MIGKPQYTGIGYTGHVMDGATGLTYMQQRYYDQSIGRFLSVDPVVANGHTGINFNRYRYALNNPYRFTDPDGRCESIATCQMMRDDLDLINGRMTQDEHRDRQEARGAGAAAGLVVLGTVYTGGRLISAFPPVAKFLAQRAAQREALRQAKAQATRGIRTLEKRIEEHQRKIDEFKENPTVRPGMEGLSDDAIKAQHAARIRHLEREIKAFKNGIEKFKEVVKK
jgi:RHS repeat-associated protein